MTKLAVITGASGGIGSMIATTLADQYELLLIGRNEKKIKSIG